jgi:hypothetical protein
MLLLNRALKKIIYKVVVIVFVSLCFQRVANGQTKKDSAVMIQNNRAAADDPSQFITRVEFFSELQSYQQHVYLNQTTIRGIVKLGKRFTTRVDIPVVYNSFSVPGQRQFGLGDISFRLLGYQIIESPKSAVTASVEFSLNTAQSRLLGTGKNMIIPVVSYSTVIRSIRGLFSLVFQQVNSFSGDDHRQDVSFSKVQAILIKTWSRKMWTVVAPSLYVNYVGGGTSMVFEGRMTMAPRPRINFWVQAGAGLYGDFILRYQWSAQLGYRYMILRSRTNGN